MKPIGATGEPKKRPRTHFRECQIHVSRSLYDQRPLKRLLVVGGYMNAEDAFPGSCRELQGTGGPLKNPDLPSRYFTSI